MATNSTLLCIHRDPGALSLLQQHYELLTATTGHEGLQLFMSQPVDGIVLDYQLGLLDGGVVAAAIKQVKPHIPIVMLAEHMDIPIAAVNSVDALVIKSDLDHSLLETIHSVLNVKPAQHAPGAPGSEALGRTLPPRESRDGSERRHPPLAQSASDEMHSPFSPKVWRSIRDGNIQF